MSPKEIAEAIRDLFEPLVDPAGETLNTTPGLAAGFVTESGSGVVGLGTTQVGDGGTPDGATFFAIASVSKIFTGFVLAKAVLDGNIKLDESINTYLKDDLNVDPSITASQLVSHTSGLPDLPDNLADFSDLDRDGRNDSVPAGSRQRYSRAQLAECLRSEWGGRGGSRARLKYSNLGFGILGIALADTLGFKGFDGMVRATIANPLGMVNTGVRSSSLHTRPGVTPATGYRFDGGRLRPVPFPDMGALAPAGGLISTADDMLRLLGAITGIRSTPLWKVFAKAMTPLHAEGDAEIAYGIRIIRSRSGARIYGKAGETSGYTSLILWMTEPKIGFILLANRGHFDHLGTAGLQLMGRATAAYHPDTSEPAPMLGANVHGAQNAQRTILANERVHRAQAGYRDAEGNPLRPDRPGVKVAIPARSVRPLIGVAKARAGVRPSRKEVVSPDVGGPPDTPKRQRRKRIAERLRRVDQSPGEQTQVGQVSPRVNHAIVPADRNADKVANRSPLDSPSNSQSAGLRPPGLPGSVAVGGAADAQGKRERRKRLAQRLRALDKLDPDADTENC